MINKRERPATAAAGRWVQLSELRRCRTPSTTRAGGVEVCGEAGDGVDPPELVRAVRQVADGDALLAPSITRRLIESYTHRPMSSTDPRLATLTKRELDVLRGIATGASNLEISAQLYVSPATVKTHVARLLAKLDLRDRVQAVVFAYETGVVQPGERAGS